MDRGVIGFKASPEPCPMDSPVRLKDICFDRIPHSKIKIIIPFFNLPCRPQGKTEIAEALWKSNSGDSMKMDFRVSFIPLLGIDMDVISLGNHPFAEIDQIPFRPPLLSGKISDGCCKL